MCDDIGADDVRGARGSWMVGHWVLGDRGDQGCSRLGGCGAGAAVYLGPVVEDAYHNVSTAASCPGFPCQTFLPQNYKHTLQKKKKKKIN